MSKTQKTTRKALALLLVLAMCLSLMPTFAFAADDVTFSKLTTGSIEVGKEYMFVGVSGGGSGSDSTKGYALANNDTYGTSSSDGTSGQKFNISSTGSTVKISSDMAQYVTWEAVKSGDGIAFKCGDKYLSAASNSSVQMSDTPTAFTVSNLAVKDGSKTLCYGSNSLGQSYVFNFNSSTSGNSKAVTVYVKDDGTGGSTDPEVRTVAIEATKTTATTKDVTIAVGETINISVTHGSGEAKTFTNVSADTSVASVESGSSFSIDNKTAGTVTVKGLKNGSTTITCTGSGSAQGSKYIAIINLTVGEGGGDDPDVPPVSGKSVDIKASTSGASKEESIAVGEVLTINLENGSSSQKTYTISVDKPDVASADPASSIQISGSKTGEIKVTGLTDGVAVIKCTASGNSGTYSATVTVTVGSGGSEEPPVSGQKVDIEAKTGTAKADVTIAVGEVLTINVTHSSRANKSFANVSSDPTVASVESGSSFSISSSQTGTLTVKGLKDGVTKITCTGTSTSGSAYIAEITVTVGEGGSDEPDVPPVSGKSVDVKASTSGAFKEESIAIGEVLTINLENGSGSSKTYTISVDKPGVASADPASSIQISGSKTGEIKVTGLTDGVAVIKCTASGNSGTYSATVTVTVGEGGSDEPTGKSIDITASSSGATESTSIDVGEKLTVNLKNGSSYNEKEYSIVVKGACAKADTEVLKLAKSATGSFTVEGLADGTAVITCTAESGSGSNYTATINLTVGTGGSTEPTGDTVYTKVDKLEIGKTYLIVSADSGSASALTNNSGSVAKTAVTVSGDKITASGLEKAEWVATEINNDNVKNGIGLKNDTYALKLTSSSPGIKIENNGTYSYGHFDYTENGYISYPYGGGQGSATMYYLGWSSDNFAGKSSQSGLGKVYIFVKGEGGTDPVVPTGVFLAFSSDVHSGTTGDDSVGRLQNWISTLTGKLGGPFDRMGFCGDLGPASGSQSSFFQNAQKVMDVVENNANVLNGGFYVCGNHEYSPGNYTHNYNDTTRMYSDAGTYVIADNYILYSLGARQGSEEYPDADINAMSEFLAAHADFKGPVFILAHYPLHAYSGSGESSGIHNGKAAVGSAKIINVLNNYPNAIFLWGHNHSSNNDHYDAVYTDKINNTEINFTYAAAGCMVDGNYGASSSVKGKGLVAAIGESSVTLTYYDAGGSVVGTPATIPMKQGHTHVYGDASYTWSKDLTSCTASRSCTVEGCTSVQTETVQTVKTTTAPTCTASGKDVYTATFTNSAFAKQTQEVTLDPVDHSYGDPTYKWSDDFSSCTATRKCSVCRTEDNATVGSESKTVPATCTAEGSITYTATFAGDVFKTQTKTVGIDKLPHSYGDVSYVWAEDGSKCTASRTCTACPAVESEDGNVEQTAHVDATCTVDGSTTYTASFENEAFTGSTKTVTVKSVGHIPGAPVQENVVDASCTVAGSYDEVVYCTECEEELSRDHKEGVMLPHSYGEVTYTWTETDNGWSCEASHKCANCPDEESEVGNVKQTAHVDVTCTTDGSTTYTASFTNEAFTGDTKTVVIEHKGHISGDPVQENIVEATCKDAGSYDEVVYCIECQEEISRTQKTIEKSTVHTPVVDAAVEATCTATGLTEGSHCSVCEKVLVEQKVVDMKEHTPVVDKAVEATCTATGLTEGSHCDVCKKVLVEQKVVDMKDHTSVTDAAVKATCTEAGLTEGSHCDVCKKILVAQEIVPALGHDFQNGECTRCHEKQPTGTVYTLTDKFVMGNTYLIVSVKDGKGVALTNNNNTFTTTSVTVSNGKITTSDLAKAEWAAQPTKTGSDLIGLYNDGHVLKVNGDSLSITTSATSYNAGGFGYTSANHVSYPYGSNPKDYFIGFANDTFKAASSENNLGEVYIFVKEGGTDPVDPPASGSVDITAKQGGSTEKVSATVGDVITVNLRNGSTYNDKTYTVTVSGSGVAKASVSEIAIVKDGTASFTVTALNAGTATITCTATSGGNNGNYVATIELTVAPESGEHTHRFGEASYVWSDDFSSCTATRSCSCGEKETETVTSTSAHKNATCKAEGSDTYTATFTNAAFAVQTKVVSIAKTAHTPETDAAVKATCTETGLTEGSHCSVCGDVITAQEVIPALGHNYVDGECTRCHEKQPTGTVYTLADKFVMGNTYLIVSVKDGKGVALTNNNNTFTTTSVTVSDGKIINSDLAKAEWAAQPTKTGSDLIGLYNDGHVLKVNGDSLSITTSATSYNAGGFGYTSANHVSYPYGSNPKDYFIGFANDTFKAASSENNLGEVYIFVKEGGTDPVDPPVSDATVNATAKSGGQSYSVTVAKGGVVTVNLTNGSSYNEKTYTITVSNSGVAQTSVSSITIPSSGTKSFTINALDEGTATITCTATSGGGSDYVATINLTVGEGGGDEPTGENVPVEATTAGTNTKLTLEVGEEIVIALTHASRASKDFTIEINNSGIAQLTPAAAITVDTGATGYITVKALNEGSATITLTGVNSASVGNTGSTYTATIELTVAPESGEHTHRFGEASYVWSDDFASCTATRTCSCGEKETETVNSTSAHKDATCKAEGSDTYTATFTNAAFEAQTKVVTIAKLAHTPGEAVIENEVKASCKAAGSYDEVVYCSECEEELSRVTKTVDKLAHTPGETVIENEVKASCKAAGSYDEVIYCTECEEELSRDTKTVDKLAHTVVTDAAVEATCTATGLTEGSHCSVCKEILVEQKVVPVKAHTPGEAVIENTVEATCSETGSYDEVVYCSVCKAELSRETKTIDKIAHTPVTDAAKAATCTETGLTEGSHCSVCGEILVEQEVVPMKEHTPGEVMKTDVVPETCLVEGSYTELVFCAECNTLISRETKTIPVHAHTAVVDAGKAATCTATGLTEGSHCSECGLTLVEQKVIPAKGHTAGETKHENIVDATCTVAGSYDEVVYCADCGIVLSKNHVTGKVLPHTPGEAVIENVKDATCKAAGSCEKVIYCTVCKAELSRETKVIDKLAHTPVTDVAVAATCTATGLTEGSHCSVCGEILIAQEVVPVKDHTPGAAVIENTVEATCSKTGSYDEVVYCSVCKKELSRVTKTIDKLAHTPVTDAAVAATCTATGLTEGSHCSVCGEILVAQEVVPMKDHTPGAVVIENMKAATCKAAGSCEEVIYCTVCNAEISRVAKVIDKLAHTPAVDAAVAATCTGTGLTEGIHCSVCGEILIAQEVVPALGHSFKDGKCTVCGAIDPSFKNPFTDIGNLNASFQKSILWAYNSGIASGKSATTFDPNGECTRGQVVTFLWRAAGKPEPTPVASNPYSDVKEGAYYYKAILWAAEQGITAGYADGTFKPDQVVSRAQFITFLWRYEGKPMPTSSESPFTDVTGGAYYNAILWGVENGIVSGYGNGTFCPNNVCTRAHVVAFLYRYGVEE